MQMRAAAVKKNTAFETELDTHSEITLDFTQVQEHLKNGYRKPFLLVASSIVRSKIRRFRAAMPRVHPHYAVKANPDRGVLQTLIEEGAGFEIASIAELDLLLSLNVPPQEIYYSNPIKSREYLEYAAAKGVEWYALDSVEELCKIVSVKHDAKLYVRIDVPNIGADWPLSGKFGAHAPEIREIISTAAGIGADLAGVTFHVGSQCRNPENWRVGIERAKRVFRDMKLAGLRPRLLNIGGGYPVRHTKPIPAIEMIGSLVNRGIADLPGEIRVIAEPGRYLVSDSAYFVCRVIGTATRKEKRWMYWDAGMFGGMIEIAEGLQYRIFTDRKGRDIPWCIAGPTCDSVDVLMRDQMLPEDVQEGDLIYIPNAGAYTTAYASNFNGFPLPEVLVI